MRSSGANIKKKPFQNKEKKISFGEAAALQLQISDLCEAKGRTISALRIAEQKSRPDYPA